MPVSLSLFQSLTSALCHVLTVSVLLSVYFNVSALWSQNCSVTSTGLTYEWG